MPYFFTFKVNHHIQFRAPLVTKRCICESKNGERCKHKTVIGSPYCYIHLLYNKHLRIKPSNIQGAGVGVFAINPKLPQNAIIFRPGDTIIRYDGQVIDNEELNDRYDIYTAPYCLQINQHETEDGALERGTGIV